ncbi:hypothetical protein L1049_003879 [Liquidambar formosana]|uniref:PGG domain-containing protein n=1 Tax=Liquidambar formosana TaxID=63359 RepID=A0AAP0X077_LIQFO
MERRLYEASLSGNVHTLKTLIQEDKLILDRVTVNCFDENPLHIAALRGHLDFTRALLSQNPDLATELDSFGHSPLHLAAVKGYTAIVRELLRVSSTMCLVRDRDGRIPLHLAAMKGRVEVIPELIRARPESTSEKLDGGETVLHLCVRYNRLEALKLLADLERNEELVNSKDDYGNTILHLAATLKQMEIIKYLVSSKAVKIKANALNGYGLTALDALEQCPKDLKSMEIRDFLLQAGVQRAKDLKTFPHPTKNVPEIEKPTTKLIASPVASQSKARNLLSKAWKVYLKADSNYLEEARGNLMVTATVTATIAFQSGINPPGGVWPETTSSHQAGTSVLATEIPAAHSIFLAYNTVSLVASLSIILLMVSGFPLKNKLSTWLLMIAMSVTVSFMALTYLVSLDMLTPDDDWNRVDKICAKSFATCIGVFVFVILLHTTRLLTWLGNSLPKFVNKRWPSSPPNDSPVSV